MFKNFKFMKDNIESSFMSGDVIMKLNKKINEQIDDTNANEGRSVSLLVKYPRGKSLSEFQSNLIHDYYQRRGFNIKINTPEDFSAHYEYKVSW